MQSNVYIHGTIQLPILYFLSQASAVNGLIADEYLKYASTPEDIRDAFTEIMGDLLMTLPVLKVVGHLSGLKSQGINVTLNKK